MQTDELRRELRQLADEQDAFTPDLGAIRRRQRRRAVVLRSAAAVVAVLVVAAGAALRSRDTQTSVASARKEFHPGDLRLDLVVVPASPQVRRSSSPRRWLSATRC